LFSIEHIAKHVAACVHGKIKCLDNLCNECSWNGFKRDLKKHVTAAHPDGLVVVSTLLTTSLSRGWVLLSCFGQLFIYYKEKRDGKYYAAVQLIGTSSQASKFKYELTLRAANGIEQISKTFLVHGYSENFETVFNSRKCFNLDEETVKFFVVDEKLQLTVTLSRVH
jgi:hypothetical protein